MQFEFLIVDVFSDRQFGGNQLAVLTDARGLSADGMQLVAREFDFTETTFVFPAKHPECTRSVRIFTPGGELPFAGHPTLGTACALVMSGIEPPGAMTLEEGLGRVGVTVEQRGTAHHSKLRLEAAPELSEDLPPLEEIAAMLSLEAAEVVDVFCAGVGVNFTFVQLAGEECVDRAALDRSAWTRNLGGRWGPHLYLFSGVLMDEAKLYARMFAPGLGVAEDAATGSAVAALVGVGAMKCGSDGRFALDVTQGIAMGRPSRLSASALLEGGRVKAVEVGGACAFVAKGLIDIEQQFLQ